MTVEITVTPDMSLAIREAVPPCSAASFPVEQGGELRVRLTLTAEAAAAAALCLCDVADEIRVALMRARR